MSTHCQIDCGLMAYIWYQCTVRAVIHSKNDECKEDGSQTVCIDAWAVPSLLRLHDMASNRPRQL